MSRDENGDALRELIKQVKKVVESYMKKAEFDKTYTGIISAVNPDGYTVKYNGTEINIKTTATDMFKKNNSVKFCVPNNNLRSAYLVSDVETMKRYIDKRFEELNK